MVKKERQNEALQLKAHFLRSFLLFCFDSELQLQVNRPECSFLMHHSSCVLLLFSFEVKEKNEICSDKLQGLNAGKRLSMRMSIGISKIMEICSSSSQPRPPPKKGKAYA